MGLVPGGKEKYDEILGRIGEAEVLYGIDRNLPIHPPAGLQRDIHARARYMTEQLTTAATERKHAELLRLASDQKLVVQYIGLAGLHLFLQQRHIHDAFYENPVYFPRLMPEQCFDDESDKAFWAVEMKDPQTELDLVFRFRPGEASEGWEYHLFAINPSCAETPGALPEFRALNCQKNALLSFLSPAATSSAAATTS